jgi:hypothetical protein
MPVSLRQRFQHIAVTPPGIQKGPGAVVFIDETPKGALAVARRGCRFLTRQEALIGSHELIGADRARKRTSCSSTAEIPPYLPRAVSVFVHIFELEQGHVSHHTSSHDVATAFSRASIAGWPFSPLSTVIDPSGLTVTRLTRSPALSAALIARRT